MNNYYDDLNEAPAKPSFPMKWHKFLIYFILWAGALVNIGSCGTYLGGLHYDGMADQVYMVFPSLNMLDKLMGVLCLGMAVLCIITRFALARYKANGPKLLMLSYTLGFIVPLAYVVLAAVTAGLPIVDMFDSSTIGSLVGSIAMVFINKFYYDKRAALFVN